MNRLKSVFSMQSIKSGFALVVFCLADNKNCKVARSNPVATTYLLAERVKASNEKKTISNDRLDKSLYLPMVTYLLLDIHPAVYTCTVYILMCMYITCSVVPVFGYLNMLSINVFSFHMCCWYIGQQ